MAWSRELSEPFCVEKKFLLMLVLAGVGLIFFIVAGMGLCFGFVLKTVLIMLKCFVTAEQCLCRVKAFSASHPTPPVWRLGGALEVGRGHSRDS